MEGILSDAIMQGDAHTDLEVSLPDKLLLGSQSASEKSYRSYPLPCVVLIKSQQSKKSQMNWTSEAEKAARELSALGHSHDYYLSIHSLIQPLTQWRSLIVSIPPWKCMYYQAVRKHGTEGSSKLMIKAANLVRPAGLPPSYLCSVLDVG